MLPHIIFTLPPCYPRVTCVTPCHSHVTYMSFPCYLPCYPPCDFHVILMLLTCYTHVTQMLPPCYSHVSFILPSYCQVTHMSPPCHLLLHPCCTMLRSYCAHVAVIERTRGARLRTLRTNIKSPCGGWGGAVGLPLHKEPLGAKGCASISEGSQRFDPILNIFRESSEALRPVRNATRAGLKHN